MLNLFIDIYFHELRGNRGIYWMRRLTTSRTCCPFGSIVLIKTAPFHYDYLLQIYLCEQ